MYAAIPSAIVVIVIGIAMQIGDHHNPILLEPISKAAVTSAVLTMRPRKRAVNGLEQNLVLCWVVLPPPPHQWSNLAAWFGRLWQVTFKESPATALG